MRHRRLRVFIFAGKLIGDFIQFLNQRVIKHRFVAQPAASDRMIAFLHLMLLELLRQQSSRFARQPHQQHAGRRPVKAMGGEYVLAYLVAHGLHHHHFFITIQPAAVHQPARWLVHRDQPLVLI